MPFDFTTFQSSQFLIPFLFVLAIIFGSLKVANIFKSKNSRGEETQNTAVNFLISLALAYFAVSNQAFVQILWSQFGNIAIFFIAMFFLIFILEAFGVRRHPPGIDPKETFIGPLFIDGAILFILLSISFFHMNLFPSLPFIGDGKNLFLLLSLIFVIVIFWLAFRIGGPVSAKDLVRQAH